MSELPRRAPAIVGMGCIFPAAPDLGVFWTNLRDGVDAIEDVPTSHFPVEDYFDPDPSAPDRIYSRRGGFLRPVAFDALRWGIAPRDLDATDTTQLLGLAAAQAALQDAGYGPGGRALPRETTSVILGVTGALELVVPLGARLGHPLWRRALADAGVDDDVAEDVVQRISAGYVPWKESSFPGLLGNVAAGRIANRLDLHGTNCVVDAACASSLSAVHLAMLELQTGRADVVLAGGLDTFNDIFMYMCFSKTPALSPSGEARPFDRDADGTTLGEGLGILVLKRLEDAERDGDRVYAVLRGMGSSSDGKGQAIYAPSAEGQARALRRAYAAADVPPRSVELVEAHGTGTRVGDAVEVQGLRMVFGADEGSATARAPACAVGSVKSMIGHTKAAAGAAGLIKVALALHHKVIPPTLKVREPTEVLRDPASPFYLATRARPWVRTTGPRRAGVSAFGFGGSNFHGVLEEHVGSPPPVHPWGADAVQIVAFSGASQEGVAQALAATPRELEPAALRHLAAATRRAFAATHAVRVVLVCPAEAWPDRRERALAVLRGEVEAAPDVFLARGPAAAVGVLFVGQGAQRVDMLRDLAVRFTPMIEGLDEAEAAMPGLAARIYPPPAWTDETRGAQEAELRATEVAQPALAAVCLGAWKLLRAFGLRPDATAGHSFGELVALAASGRIDAETLHRLARCRGLRMAEGAGDRGAMLAVHLPLPELEAWLAGEELALTLANRNAPRQGVLAGPTGDIEEAARRLAARGVGTSRLSVAAAFHSPLVAGAARGFADDLAPTRWQPGEVPVYGNTTARPYPAEAPAAALQLADQLARPVDFVGMIERMADDGISVFVEVGPGHRLTDLVRRIRPEATAVALDGSQGHARADLDLARVLATVAVHGGRVDLSRWDPEPPPVEPPPRWAVPLCGANVRSREPAPPPRPRPAPAPPAAPSVPTTVAGPAAPPIPTMSDERSSAPPPLAGAEPLQALLALQAQTADIHRQFLEGQAEATRIFERLLTGVAAPEGRATPARPGSTFAAPGLADAGSQAVARPQPAPAPSAAAPPQVTPTVATPPPVAAPEPAAASPRAEAGSAVADLLLRIVAEKTGYPLAMLDLDMGLDADLGIDSIKRVEILAAVQEARPEAPAIEADHLGELRTLRQIAAFLGDGAESPAPAPGPDVARIGQALVQIVAEKTGYPTAMIELDMGLDADLGIDSIKRVEILAALQEAFPQAPTLDADAMGELRTLADIAAHMAGSPPPRAVVAAEPRVAPRSIAPEPRPRGTAESAPFEPSSAADALLRWIPVPRPWAGALVPVAAPAGRIAVTRSEDGLSTALVAALEAQGLPAFEVAWEDLANGQPLAADGLVLVAPRPGVTRHQLRAALHAARDHAARLASGWLVAITRLGGHFGLDGLPPHADPRAAGLLGLVKTAAREWPQVHARAIDLPEAFEATDPQALVALVRTRGPVELGLPPEGPCRVALEPAPALPGRVGVGPDDVALLTGGARGVTASVARALARAGVRKLVLLGRTAAPERDEPADLAAAEDEVAVKRWLAAQPGLARTPQGLHREAHAVLARREIRGTLADLDALGCRARYRAVDVRDPEAVAQTLAELQPELGPVTVLVHGAGVLRDRRIADKRDDDFDAVYETKVEGLEHVLAALHDAPPRALVVFSSSTARFGRAGQSDYAMANEVLDKRCQQLARAWPQAQVLALCWGPWNGGMVDAALRERFAAEGVRTLELEAGADCVLRSLHAGAPVECVVLGPGSSLPEPEVADPDGAGPVASLRPAGERTLSLEDIPALADHALAGRPVLPIALAVEWLGHAALHEHPGLRLVGIDGLKVFRGLTLEPGAPRRIRWLAGAASRDGEHFHVRTQLCSEAGVHFEATVVLGDAVPQAPATTWPGPAAQGGTSPYDAGELFHGPGWHALDAVTAVETGLRAACRPAAAPERFMRSPVRRRWLADPWILDAGLQSGIVWTQRLLQTPSLPTAWGRYRQYTERLGAEAVEVVMQVRDRGAHRLTCDLEWRTPSGRVAARLEGQEFTLDRSLAAAFAASSPAQAVLESAQ